MTLVWQQFVLARFFFSPSLILRKKVLEAWEKQALMVSVERRATVNKMST